MSKEEVRYKGLRNIDIPEGKSITIYLISFIYPANTGYLKRMELLVNWANHRFKTVNLIIPHGSTNIPSQVLQDHLEKCDNLIIIDNTSTKKNLTLIKTLLYKVIIGHYPPLHTDMVLKKTIIEGFKKAMQKYRTDYFLNTRHNCAGFINYVPKGVTSIIDTQDIFTEIYKKYTLLDRPKIFHKLLSGYREKGDFFHTEYMSLAKYDHIIAISEGDYNKYMSLPLLKGKVNKIDGIGFKAVDIPVVLASEKKYDILVVASRFIATERGIDWLMNEVAPHFKSRISLCVVGSIESYMKEKRWKNSSLEIHIAGVVDSLKYYYENSRIVAICILEGTGTSVKGLEALSFGAAIVTTSEGVRFGGLKSGVHALICDDPEKFAESIELLINNDELRNKLGHNALKFAVDNFSPTHIFQLLDESFGLVKVN